MWNGYLEWVPLDYYYYPQQGTYENYYSSNCPINPTYENFQTNNPQYYYQSSCTNTNTNFDLNNDLNQLMNNEIIKSEISIYIFLEGKVPDLKSRQNARENLKYMLTQQILSY